MKKRDVIIVTICIATALICIAFTWWGNYKNEGILSPDAFYGVLASFIGACATIIVGFQIASFVKIHETERQIKELQKERVKLQIQNKQLETISAYLSDDLSNALVIIAKESTDNLVQIIAYMMSIYCCNIDAADKDVILKRYGCLRDCLKKAKTKDIKSAYGHIYRLENIIIPKDTTHYAKIMKLHLECVEILENAAREGKD